MKLNPAEVVKSIISEKYVQDRFVSLDWTNYKSHPDTYWSNFKVAKRKDSVTVKIEGGYNRFSEEEKREIVAFLKQKFQNVKNILNIDFKVSENYAGTKYDWLKIKLVN